MFSNRLEVISSIPDHREQATQYEALIVSNAQEQNGRNLLEILGKLLAESTPQTVTRNGVLSYAKSISQLSDAVLLEVAPRTLQLLRESSLAHPEAEYLIRSTLFDCYLRQEAYSDAALALSSLNLDARPYTSEEKVSIWIKCAEAYLEDDASVEAEALVTRAAALIHEVTEWSLRLRFQVTFARVLDANRKFVEAALRYYDISNTENDQIVQDDLLELLGKAVTVAVLGKAGPQRTRVLGILYKDARIEQLERFPQYVSHAKILARMYHRQLINRNDMTTFESSLPPHQKAVTSDGMSILEKAVIEHNMQAIGDIYRNIRLDDLGRKLGLETLHAEKFAAKMIMEDRLRATIDQTDNMLYFDAKDDNTTATRDERIASICQQLSECAERLAHH